MLRVSFAPVERAAGRRASSAAPSPWNGRPLPSPPVHAGRPSPARAAHSGVRHREGGVGELDLLADSELEARSADPGDDRLDARPANPGGERGRRHAEVEAGDHGLGVDELTHPRSLQPEPRAADERSVDHDLDPGDRLGPQHGPTADANGVTRDASLRWLEDRSLAGAAALRAPSSEPVRPGHDRPLRGEFAGHRRGGFDESEPGRIGIAEVVRLLGPSGQQLIAGDRVDG